MKLDFTLTLQETRGIHDSMNRTKIEELLVIRCIFSLVDMITNAKFSNCPYVFKIGVVQQ